MNIEERQSELERERERKMGDGCVCRLDAQVIPVIGNQVTETHNTVRLPGRNNMPGLCVRTCKMALN